jgi:hypothetical protein
VLEPSGGVGGDAENVLLVHVDDVAEVLTQQRFPAGEEHPLYAGQVGADGVQLGQGRVGQLQGLRTERAVEVAPLGDLQDHRQRNGGLCRELLHRHLTSEREMVPGGEPHGSTTAFDGYRRWRGHAEHGHRESPREVEAPAVGRLSRAESHDRW